MFYIVLMVICLGKQISNPDEFDVMVPVPVERVNVEHFRDDGAFYRVSLKRGSSPLWKFQEVDTLSGFKMLEEFREDVKNCIKPFKGDRSNTSLMLNIKRSDTD